MKERWYLQFLSVAQSVRRHHCLEFGCDGCGFSYRFFKLFRFSVVHTGMYACAVPWTLWVQAPFTFYFTCESRKKVLRRLIILFFRFHVLSFIFFHFRF